VALLPSTVTAPLLFAQSLVEHGSLDSMASNLQRSSDNVGSWLSTVSPTTWVILGGVLLIGLLIWSRR